MSTIIAPSVTVPSHSRREASQWTCFQRLLWKEYRTIRLFWLLLAGLSVLAQWLTAWLWDGSDKVAIVYNFALSAPGAVCRRLRAASFAVEREEGTIEFLRAAPVSAEQVFFSKLAIAAIGTLAMFAVLLLLARLFPSGLLLNESAACSGSGSSQPSRQSPGALCFHCSARGRWWPWCSRWSPFRLAIMS